MQLQDTTKNTEWEIRKKLETEYEQVIKQNNILYFGYFFLYII